MKSEISPKIARIFPRRTNCTPEDPLSFVGFPDLFTPMWFDEIHISITFTYDMPLAERLAEVWSMRTDKLSIGGPGSGMKGEEFDPGMYLKKGYVITSRGCPNHCWFCRVPELEGNVKELKIHAGWNVLDDNLLACSDEHITNVFKMLMKVKKYHRIEFTGGFEVGRLKGWHIDWLLKIRPKQIFFAYDSANPGRLDDLIDASCALRMAGIAKESLRCYVLIGYENDTFDKAEKRLFDVVNAGFIPMAMLYRSAKKNLIDDKDWYDNENWKAFQRLWARPALMRSLGYI